MKLNLRASSMPMPALAAAVAFALSSIASLTTAGNAFADPIGSVASVAREAEEAPEPGWVEYDPRSNTFTVKFREAESIRSLKDGILEVAAVMPKGAVISVPNDAAPANYGLRAADGSVKWSNHVFFGKVRILGVEPDDAKDFPQDKIDELNATPGGLFVSSAVVQDFQQEIIPPMKPSEPNEGFLGQYAENGKPKFQQTETFKKRFGSRLNQAIDPSDLSEEERAKWKAVFEELRKAVNRNEAVEGKWLFINPKVAQEQSVLFEEDGVVQTEGAWSIAMATAKRHGFSHVPCAEFVSEVIRQAYKRAGYDHKDDFKEIPLFYDPTALVKALADALDKAGWIPWEAAKYKPVTGAPMMHHKATSPGHTYFVAGDEGRFIVDSGSPRGRDLRAADGATTAKMHRHGVFFMPPGMIPEAW